MHSPLRPDAGLTLTARSTARSHVGLVRAINEDRVLDCAARGLWAVADGMGGHDGGDLAAQTAIDRLRALAAQPDPLDMAAVHTALTAAHEQIIARNRQLGLEAGTTIVTALLQGDRIGLAWVGDSRGYRLRDGVFAPLTRDHSVVQELVEAGLIDARAAERHPQANVVTRALGVKGAGEPEFAEVALQPGDRILLCSDGLSRSLVPVDGAAELEAMADALLAGALARDGSDNISLVLIEIA